MEIEERNNRIDELEAFLVCNFPPRPAKYRHFFVNGMYAREMSATTDSFITSQIHKFDHFFNLSKGKIVVQVDDEKVEIEAPFSGITKAGTRRVGVVVEDIVWTTYHLTDIKPKDDSEESIEEALRLIGEQIIEEHENPLLGGVIKNNILVKTL